MDKFFKCDVCGREVNGITMVNGMRFCAKCYQNTYKDATSLELLAIKDQRIAELEEENAKLESYNRQLRENYEKCIDTWKQENAKLQEQLKNAVIPKYKKGQLAWYIEENPYCNNKRQVFCGHITDITIHIWNGDNGKPVLYYKIDTSFLYIHEKEIFATEAEAQKYLEEMK